MNFGASVGVQFPTGSGSEGMKTGFGFNVVGKYFLKENIAVGLNSGYLRFGIKEFSLFGADFSGSTSFIPITGLFEYHFGTGKIKPYLGADLGAYIVITKAEGTYQGEHQSDSNSEAHFGFAPVAGLSAEINDNTSFWANLKYNDVTASGGSATWFGINAGLIFKIK